jgi:hypothetical protein
MAAVVATGNLALRKKKGKAFLLSENILEWGDRKTVLGEVPEVLIENVIQVWS